MIIQSLLISCRLQVSKVNSHSKRENRQPLQQSLPTKFFADRLQVLITHLGLLPFLQLVTSQYNRQVFFAALDLWTSYICTCEFNAVLR